MAVDSCFRQVEETIQDCIRNAPKTAAIDKPRAFLPHSEYNPEC